MTKEALLLILIILLLFAGCSKDKALQLRLNETQNPIKFRVGQQWHYQERMINRRFGGSSAISTDTSITKYNYVVSKDSVIYGDSCYIVEGVIWARNSTFLAKTHQAICLRSDTIKVYSFKDSAFGTTDVLFKSKMALDTNISSLNFPIVYPMQQGCQWVLHETDTTRYWGQVIRTYLGQETVVSNGIEYDAYKIKWEWVLDSIPKTPFYDWVGMNGLVKRYSFLDSLEQTDVNGKVIGYFSNEEIIEYFGAYNAPIDTGAH